MERRKGKPFCELRGTAKRRRAEANRTSLNAEDIEEEEATERSPHCKSVLLRLLLGVLGHENPVRRTVDLEVPRAPSVHVIQDVAKFRARPWILQRRRPAELECREVERVEEPWTLATNLVAKIYGYFQSA